MKTLAKHYNKLINPENEPDFEIRLQLEYIKRLEINVAFPFLLKVYDDYVDSTIDKNTFVDILKLIQAFVWRRFIMGLPTNALNKIFMNLYEKVNSLNYLSSIQVSLIRKTGKQKFPKNKEVLDALKTKDVYNINSKNRMYLLEQIENFENNEKVIINRNSNITIEHIFPQKPASRWQRDLNSKEYAFIQENYIHTIGNLTLSGNNGRLGNKTFIEKRDLAEVGYKDSRLWLNKDLSEIDKWNKNEIEKRFERIAAKFIQIWQYPDVELLTATDTDEVNIFEADDPKHKKLDYAIFLEKKIEATQVAKLYIEVFKNLFELHPETFFTTDLGEKIGLNKNPDAPDYDKLFPSMILIR